MLEIRRQKREFEVFENKCREVYVRRARAVHFLAQEWAEVKRRLPASWASSARGGAQRRSDTASPFDPPFTSQLARAAARKPLPLLKPILAHPNSCCLVSSHAINHMDGNPATPCHTERGQSGPRGRELD
jgi:hypothetical protein